MFLKSMTVAGLAVIYKFINIIIIILDEYIISIHKLYHEALQKKPLLCMGVITARMILRVIRHLIETFSHPSVVQDK